jgi:hypothetical protein
MILRKAVLLLAAVAAATTATAHAQLGAYGMFTVNRMGNIASSPLAGAPGTVGASTDTVDPLGGTGGVYYDRWKVGPVKLGLDLRGSILTTKRGAYVNFNAQGARIYSSLGGVRAVFHTPVAPLKPYIQGSFGLGRSDYGLMSGTGQVVLHNNFEYMGLAGLDIKVLPIMDYRVAELGYGGLDPFGANSHNYTIRQVSMGFVFHLPF